MKFQNPSLNFFLNGRKDGRTHKPKPICSPLFQSWGHKYHGRELIIFPANFANSLYFNRNTRNHHKMTENTYLRPNQHVQVNNILLYKNSWSWIISLANAKSLFKIYFGHKFFICWPIFKIFAGPFATYRDLDAVKKTFFCPPTDRSFLRKFSIRRQVLHIKVDILQ